LVLVLVRFCREFFNQEGSAGAAQPLLLVKISIRANFEKNTGVFTAPANDKGLSNALTQIVAA